MSYRSKHLSRGSKKARIFKPTNIAFEIVFDEEQSTWAAFLSLSLPPACITCPTAINRLILMKIRILKNWPSVAARR